MTITLKTLKKQFFIPTVSSMLNDCCCGAFQFYLCSHNAHMHGHSEWSTFYKSIHFSLLHFQSSMLPLLSSYFSNITHTLLLSNPSICFYYHYACVSSNYFISPCQHLPTARDLNHRQDLNGA